MGLERFASLLMRGSVSQGTQLEDPIYGSVTVGSSQSRSQVEVCTVAYLCTSAYPSSKISF
jgi:hypothetical protein